MRVGKLEAKTSTPKRNVRLYGGSDNRRRVQSVLGLSRFVGSDDIWISASGMTAFKAEDVQRALDAVMQDGSEGK